MASPANFTRRFMHGDCWISWDMVVCTHVFLWPFGFRGSVVKLCWLLPSWGRLSRSIVKSAGGKCHESWDPRTSNVDLRLCDDEELTWWFVTWGSGIVRGGNTIEQVQSLTFQGENPTSGLDWLCLAMALLNVVLWGGLSPGLKRKIYDRATTSLMHCSFLGSVVFRETRLLGLPWLFVV
jgi:hypothetical protein